MAASLLSGQWKARELVGVAIVGRPVARMLDDGLTSEVTRVCVVSHAPKNSCSFLYGRCWRIWQQMGGKRMVTTHCKSLAPRFVGLGGR